MSIQELQSNLYRVGMQAYQNLTTLQEEVAFSLAQVALQAFVNRTLAQHQLLAEISNLRNSSQTQTLLLKQQLASRVRLEGALTNGSICTASDDNTIICEIPSQDVLNSNIDLPMEPTSVALTQVFLVGGTTRSCICGRVFGKLDPPGHECTSSSLTGVISSIDSYLSGGSTLSMNDCLEVFVCPEGQVKSTHSWHFASDPSSSYVSCGPDPL